MSVVGKIRKLSENIFHDVVDLRRHFHQNPELAFEEKLTSARVKEELSKLDIPFKEMAKTGVVAILEGKKQGSSKTIALRGDMDALPIQEENTVPYASKNPGKMHACGHDVHTSSLLGAARILSELREEFSGKIKLVFQPSEEKLPGGASVMIREGVLENPKVSSIVGQHVMPYIDSGKVGIRSGMYMASTDEIYIRIKGKGGHGAHPHDTIDPVAMTAQVITACQQVVSRTMDPRIPAVLTFGKLEAHGATNIIPDEVYIEGTFRTMDEQWRNKAHRQIESTITGITTALGGSAEIDIKKGYPVLFNDEKLTGRVREFMSEYLGEENIVDLDLWMAAEDFAWYTHEVPGCFYRLGTRNEKLGIIHGLHTPQFNIDEEALKIAPGLMAWIAINELTD